MSTNESLVRELMEGGYVKKPLIIEAFRKIDRGEFVLDEYREQAYDNYPLPIGFGQTISQPLTVAFMLELLDPQPGDRVLEIGTGSGWKTALLAYIVSEGGARKTGIAGTGFGAQLDFVKPKGFRPGHVVSIERIPELHEMAVENVGKFNFIEKRIAHLVLGDGARGYKKEAPFGKIIAGATAERIPVAWKEQCRIGGRIVAPVGDTVEVHDKISSGDYIVKEYSGFRFVPLVSDAGGG